MPYYKEKKLLFLHIPKIGGSRVKDSIKKQTSQKLYSGRKNTLLDFPYN